MMGEKIKLPQVGINSNTLMLGLSFQPIRLLDFQPSPPSVCKFPSFDIEEFQNKTKRLTLIWNQNTVLKQEIGQIRCNLTFLMK